MGRVPTEATLAIERVIGRGVPLLLDDIDTDRIIPARYLKCVTFEGLGEHAFEDDRRQNSAHPFNDQRFAGSRVLVVGRNFGCGSSREHAPQALSRWGIRAIVGESFAEIFFGNCTALGIPCVRVGREELKRLAESIQTDPTTEITIDLTTCAVRFSGGSIGCEIAESPRAALLSGQWDFLAQLLDSAEAIRAKSGELPYLTNFA